MASEQFIIETHLKLNPRSKTKHYEDMTEKQKAYNEVPRLTVKDLAVLRTKP